MDAKELRIGNHTSHGKITAFERDRVYFGGVWNWINELKPIPLTEEWFTKFGYEHHTEVLAELYDLSLEHLGFPIEPHADDWVNMWSKMAVHQFQNWWKANTGEELNAQL